MHHIVQPETIIAGLYMFFVGLGLGFIVCPAINRKKVEPSDHPIGAKDE